MRPNIGRLGWVAAGVYAALVWRYGLSGAEAEHASSPHSHVASLNSANESEDYCVSVLDESISHADAFNELLERLFNQEDASRDWQGIKNVNIVPLFGECPDPTDPDEYWNFDYEFRFYVKQELDRCGLVESPAGCARAQVAYADPLRESFRMGVPLLQPGNRQRLLVRRVHRKP